MNALQKILLGLTSNNKSSELDNLQQSIDAFETATVDSSWLDTVSYDPRIKSLRVELQDGNVYTYYNVPQELYNKILTTDSPGRFINKVIKNGFYPFTRS